MISQTQFKNRRNTELGRKKVGKKKEKSRINSKKKTGKSRVVWF